MWVSRLHNLLKETQAYTFFLLHMDLGLIIWRLENCVCFVASHPLFYSMLLKTLAKNSESGFSELAEGRSGAREPAGLLQKFPLSTSQEVVRQWGYICISKSDMSSSPPLKSPGTELPASTRLNTFTLWDWGGSARRSDGESLACASSGSLPGDRLGECKSVRVKTILEI